MIRSLLVESMIKSLIGSVTGLTYWQTENTAYWDTLTGNLWDVPMDSPVP